MLDRWPNWLRWILFLPIAALVWLLAYPIILIVNVWMTPSFLRGFFMEISFKALATAVSTAAFIWVGATIAPSHKFRVSLVLAIIIGVLIGFSAVAKIMFANRISITWTEVGIGVIVGSIAAIVTVADFYEKRPMNESGHCSP